MSRGSGATGGRRRSGSGYRNVPSGPSVMNCLPSGVNAIAVTPNGGVRSVYRSAAPPMSQNSMLLPTATANDLPSVDSATAPGP